MRIKQLKRLLIEAVDRLYAKDASLITRGVHEVTISHRLAVYLEEALRREHREGEQEYTVDIEYNKNMADQKRLVPGEGGKRPDIIVHRRESNDDNLLIVEMKKNKELTDDDDDDRKLSGATNPEHDFGFKLGAYLNLKEDCSVIWYSRGRRLGSRC